MIGGHVPDEVQPLQYIYIHTQYNQCTCTSHSEASVTGGRSDAAQ